MIQYRLDGKQVDVSMCKPYSPANRQPMGKQGCGTATTVRKA